MYVLDGRNVRFGRSKKNLTVALFHLTVFSKNKISPMKNSNRITTSKKGIEHRIFLINPL